MDREIDMGDSWRAAWLDRTFRPLHCYMSVFWFATCFTIIGLSIRMMVTSIKTRRALQKSITEQRSVAPELHEKMTKETNMFLRGQFVASAVIMANVFMLIMADTFICLTAISDDVAAVPEAWTWDLLPEVAIYVLYLSVIFLGTFFLVPLLQVVLVTHVLCPRIMKNSDKPLLSYVESARAPATTIAQLWTFMAFMTAAYWPPTSENSLARYAVLQACLGSACVWLQASYTFNYCSDELEDLNEVSIRAVFYGKHCKLMAVSKKSEDVLPRYQDVPQQDTPLLEKE